jgi:hypothetical protein
METQISETRGSVREGHEKSLAEVRKGRRTVRVEAEPRSGGKLSTVKPAALREKAPFEPQGKQGEQAAALQIGRGTTARENLRPEA